MESMSGACAADYWAGPALDGKGVGERMTAKKSKSKSKSGTKTKLEKRVVKLERSLQCRESRETPKKKLVKPKKSREAESSASNESDTSSDSPFKPLSKPFSQNLHLFFVRLLFTDKYDYILFFHLIVIT